MSSLSQIAQALVADGKGILAADESTGTIKKRFDKIGVENTEDNRRAYRELLFTAPGAGKFISGVILYDETIRQRGNDGKTFVTTLERQGIISGIKVDMGTDALVGSPEEKVTKGLEGLPERLKEYKRFDAQFAKWRAVFSVRENALPTDGCILENARRLAEYALMCQQENIVPIVEPEVLMDCCANVELMYEVTKRVLKTVFAELAKAGVQLDGILLKPNMVIPGTDWGMAPSNQIAEMTLRCLKEEVSTNVPGIVFLSGGQSEAEACANLNAINVVGGQPWKLSFSYGRALQASALKTWQGKNENVEAAQKAFLHRAELASQASLGKYRGE